MDTIELEPAGYQPEKALQQLFDNWALRGQASWMLAGVPAWLAALGQPNAPQRRRATWEGGDLGYAFQPDVEWSDYVAELKSGAKYEPLALAEVLHHCAMLENAGAAQKTAVIVGRYNPWTRATLWRLAGGTSLSPTVVRYVEHTALRDATQEYLMLHEPLAAWIPCSAPPEPQLDDLTVEGTWHRAEGGNSWVKSARSAAQRQPFQTTPYQIIAAMESEERAYISWQGHDGIDGAYVLHRFR